MKPFIRKDSPFGERVNTILEKLTVDKKTIDNEIDKPNLCQLLIVN